MKRAVILHGTGNNPSGNWFPWLKSQLENKGYSVWVPDLPGNETPNRQIYNDYLFSQNWDFSDNIIIGHSSGAVSVLNIIEDERCPKIKTGVLVGAWSQSDKQSNFGNLFPQNGFNFPLIKQKAQKLLFIHGDNDPLCPLEQAKWLAEKTESEIVIVPGGQHFSMNIDPIYSTFPKLIEILSQKSLI